MSLSITNELETSESRELVEHFSSSMTRIREQVRKIIVGQDEVVESLLLTLLVGGHCLITGMPGTAKTLLVRTLATALGLVMPILATVVPMRRVLSRSLAESLDLYHQKGTETSVEV